MLTPVRIYSSDNIDELNKQLWADISLHGNQLIFGNPQHKKKAREIYAVVQLYGEALERLYNGDVPKGWMFRGDANKDYIEMLKDFDKGEQPYTYGQRIGDYPIYQANVTSVFNINQYETCREKLKLSIESGIQSNSIVGILWHPEDIKLKDPPCFNSFQLRVSDGNKVSLRVNFRSHDYGHGCFANWGAIIRAFRDLVIDPAGGELEELICESKSAHIYDNDEDMKNRLIGRIPSSVKRLLGVGA